MISTNNFPNKTKKYKSRKNEQQTGVQKKTREIKKKQQKMKFRSKLESENGEITRIESEGRKLNEPRREMAAHATRSEAIQGKQNG